MDNLAAIKNNTLKKDIINNNLKKIIEIKENRILDKSTIQIIETEPYSISDYFYLSIKDRDNDIIILKNEFNLHI